jgi:hypothetical protein
MGDFDKRAAIVAAARELDRLGLDQGAADTRAHAAPSSRGGLS